MAIITISRGSYSKGKEVAEMVAAKLGYDCISREVLIKASDRFNIPEVKLIRAIHDAPSILERFGRKRQAFVAFIRSELACRVSTDNVVYHGLAGHLLQRVSRMCSRSESSPNWKTVLLQQNLKGRA